MKNKGFSLIELIVVLVLIGLSISLVTPSLSRLSKTIELKGAAQKISAILRYCRSEAVNKGQVYQILFDSDLREVRVQTMESIEEKEESEKREEKAFKKTYPLPSGINMREVKIASPQYPSSSRPLNSIPMEDRMGDRSSWIARTEKDTGSRFIFSPGWWRLRKSEMG